NGYCVQRIADMNDQAMTPAGATTFRPVSFVLQNNGTLTERTSTGTITLSTGIFRISDQGIDNAGRAMIDVVATDGTAYEYHDGNGWFKLTTGVVDAKAGQGVSFLLL